jgi:hypothetical protein
VASFDDNFNGIQGSMLPSQPDAETYFSTTCLPNALHCIIYRYHSVMDKSASWQAIMYAGDNFDDAIKAYKNTFNQVKRSQVKGIANKISSFEGKMENPDENIRFAVSSLRLKTDDIKFKDLVAEIELSNNYEGWEVHLNLYSKKYQQEKDKED